MQHIYCLEKDILDEMTAQGISIKGMATLIGVEQSHLTRVLRVSTKDKRNLTQGLLADINSILNKDFKLQTNESNKS